MKNHFSCRISDLFLCGPSESEGESRNCGTRSIKSSRVAARRPSGLSEKIQK